VINSTGATSTVAIASDLFQAAGTSPSATKVTSPLPAVRRIDELSGINALLNPTTESEEGFTPRRPSSTIDDPSSSKAVADRHLTNYFATIHNLIPVLHEGAFRALYDGFWSRLGYRSPSLRTDSNLQKLTAPLVYSVLALGALYESGYNDNAFWAKEWFARAREGIKDAAEDCSFELCLAVYFVASYSQHVINPHLAYNFLGVALRLAYSIGLNRSSVPVAYSEAAWPSLGRPLFAEMCKRIWWQVSLISESSRLM
jgi:Fungal specific transcription factor domain